jgi:hypothetical protein
VDFSLLSQQVVCFFALQQPTAPVVGIVSLVLADTGKRESSLDI